MQPFNQTREQAVTVVAIGKGDLDAQSINSLNVKYAALQQEANGYIGFITESINVGGLDSDKNKQYAESLSKAIAGFNGSIAPIMPSPSSNAAAIKPPLPLPDAWLDQFSSTLQAEALKYQSELKSMDDQERTKAAEQIKTYAAWPNFQDIAAKQVTVPTSTPASH